MANWTGRNSKPLSACSDLLSLVSSPCFPASATAYFSVSTAHGALDIIHLCRGKRSVHFPTHNLEPNVSTMLFDDVIPLRDDIFNGAGGSSDADKSKDGGGNANLFHTKIRSGQVIPLAVLVAQKRHSRVRYLHAFALGHHHLWWRHFRLWTGINHHRFVGATEPAMPARKNGAADGAAGTWSRSWVVSTPTHARAIAAHDLGWLFRRALGKSLPHCAEPTTDGC